MIADCMGAFACTTHNMVCWLYGHHVPEAIQESTHADERSSCTQHMLVKSAVVQQQVYATHVSDTCSCPCEIRPAQLQGYCPGQIAKNSCILHIRIQGSTGFSTQGKTGQNKAIIVPTKFKLEGFEGINSRGQDEDSGVGAKKGEGIRAAGLKVGQLRGVQEGCRGGGGEGNQAHLFVQCENAGSMGY